uniref:Large ribosomal subunit protein mL52 n=1 Tax=Hucho hucho TaxID=62062 RepID=A0A4W5JXS4_9TELE
MAAHLRTLCSTALRQSSRFTTTCGAQYGPLTDFPDWSFADGRSAPPLKGQLRRNQERETLPRRVVNLSSEVDEGMEVWSSKREEAKRMEERNKSLLLKTQREPFIEEK